MRKDKVYISGPMTDKATGKVSAENLAAFHHAERLLREMGYRRIVNPTRVWACRWPWLYRIVGYNLTLLYDLRLLMGCGQIYKIPGWRASRGANIESCVAFHFRIWPIRHREHEIIDKKLAKRMAKGMTINN